MLRRSSAVLARAPPRTSRRGSPRAAPGWWCAATARARWRRSSCARRGRSRRRRRAPPGRPPTLLAAIDAPVPVQQQTTRLVGAALGHVAGGGLAGPGPVVALAVRQRAVQQRLVAAAAQLLHHGVGDARALVGGHGDPHREQPTLGPMPELPEVEITARRLSRARRGRDDRVRARAGHGHDEDLRPAARRARRARRSSGVRRVGKMLAVETGELVVLVHLMSAGRLQLWDDARLAARPRLAAADPARRRPRAATARVRHPAARLGEAAARRRRSTADDAVATLGPDAYPAPPPEEFARLLDQPRHLHPLLRDQRTIAGIGRSWVDELLWTARLSPFQKGVRARRRRASSGCARRATRCWAARSSTTRR